MKTVFRGKMEFLYSAGSTLTFSLKKNAVKFTK